MLKEDPEVMLAAWKNIFIKLLGFLALVLMTGILLNLILALLSLLALTVQRWRRTRRMEATGTRRMPKEGAMKPRAADEK